MDHVNSLHSSMVWAAALLGVWALAWWLLSVRLRDVGVVDISWGLMYVLVATVCVVVAEASSPRSLLVAGMATLWGLRLGAYLAWRNLGHPEDRRYVAIRARNDPGFWWKSLFMVFLLQAALAWVISLPIQIAITAADSPLGLLDALACGLWAIGLFFEAVGDGQLARFKARHENEGKVMDRGLWRYTRHPNYFGDFCVWWALYLIAIPASGAWTIVSPLLMTVLLLRVSGVTLLESDIAERRPAYAEYIRRTNAFFPGPRRPLG